MVGMGIVGVAPAAEDPKPSRARNIQLDQLVPRVLLAVVLGAVAAFVTQWPVAAVGAAVSGLVIPSIRRTARDRARSLERTEAVAAWTEMLRDTMAAASGLNEAILASARVAPAAIRVEVQALAVRSEHQPLARALRRFAAGLDDPVADSVVAALILSTERQAGSLGSVLTQIATNAREQAAMRQRIEASRARTYASVRFVVIVTLVFSIGLVAPVYLKPFGTAEGQLMLAVVFGLFGAAGWALHRMGQPTELARLLIGEETGR
jgi:hypothetical protein